MQDAVFLVIAAFANCNASVEFDSCLGHNKGEAFLADQATLNGVKNVAVNFRAFDCLAICKYEHFPVTLTLHMTSISLFAWSSD